MDTEIGEFPFMALLGSGQEGNITWSCGGSIINKVDLANIFSKIFLQNIFTKWFVLSAAHCGPTVDFVRLGEWKAEWSTDCRAQRCY